MASTFNFTKALPHLVRNFSNESLDILPNHDFSLEASTEVTVSLLTRDVAWHTLKILVSL